MVTKPFNNNSQRYWLEICGHQLSSWMESRFERQTFPNDWITVKEDRKDSGSYYIVLLLFSYSDFCATESWRCVYLLYVIHYSFLWSVRWELDHIGMNRLCSMSECCMSRSWIFKLINTGQADCSANNFNKHPVKSTLKKYIYNDLDKFLTKSIQLLIFKIFSFSLTTTLYEKDNSDIYPTFHQVYMSTKFLIFMPNKGKRGFVVFILDLCSSNFMLPCPLLVTGPCSSGPYLFPQFHITNVLHTHYIMRFEWDRFFLLFPDNVYFLF